MEKTLVTKVTVKLKPIMTPNFILTENGVEPIPVTSFTEDELRELGAEFTENLLKKRANGITGTK